MASQETSYYNEGNVQVTSARAVMGGTTYPLANISSVGVGEQSNNKLPGIALLLVTLVAVVYALTNGNDAICWVAAVVMGGIGILILVQKPNYFVKVGSAGGEQRALVSKDRAYIEKIVAALNEAIIKRG